MMTGLLPRPDHQVGLLLEFVEGAGKEASERVVIDLVVDRDADQGSPLPEANGVAGGPVHKKLEQRRRIAVVELGEESPDATSSLTTGSDHSKFGSYRLGPAQEFLENGLKASFCCHSAARKNP